MKYLDLLLNRLGLVRKKKTLEYLFCEYHKWAEKQFPNSTALSSIEGLKREIVELEDSIKYGYVSLPIEHQLPIHANQSCAVAYEYVDVLMYCMDSARRYGIKPLELFDYFRQKLEINKNRKWSINSDKSYSHIKDSQEPRINEIPSTYGC
jgi:hypothetical protein